MSKDIKKMMINHLCDSFKNITECVVIDISTLDSSETFEFRQKMSESGVSVKGVKTSLARQAFTGSPLEEMSSTLKGHSFIASSDEDIVSLAKSLVDWSKQNEKIMIKGGFFEGQSLDGDGVVNLSKMSSREELLATVVLQSMSPGTSIAGQLSSPGSQIAGAIDSLVEKLEKESA